MLPINRNPDVRVLASFRRIWFPLFVVAAGVMLWWQFDLARAAWAVWAVGAAVEVVVIASERVARAVFVGLQMATYPIGLVVSTIALALTFYLVMTPIGWVMRLAGRDPLRLRERDASSHWLESKQDEEPQRAFRQF